MKKSATEKVKTKQQLPAKDKKITSEEEQDSAMVPYSNSTTSLMPELEELVKKNPNRLIGCGG